MSAAGGRMIQSIMLTSAKRGPTDEAAFTEKNDGVGPLKNFKEAINNAGMLGEMVQDGIIREVLMDGVPGNKHSIFQNKFSYIFINKHVTRKAHIHRNRFSPQIQFNCSKRIVQLSIRFRISVPGKVYR